jgi:DNA/RNA endonuclease YhcR with UshA esterase domain
MELTEQKLIIISLVIAAAGLVALVLIIRFSAPMEYETFAAQDDGVTVRLTGTVTRVRSIGESALLELETECKVPAILFDMTAEELQHLEGQEVTVSGTKSTYKGGPEILVESVKLTE